MDGEPVQQVEEARLLLDARKELYGETDPETIDAMRQLASALRNAESYNEAESVLRTSLSIQNRSNPSDEARITRTEFDLAIVLDRLGETDSARRVLGEGPRSLRPSKRLRQRAVHSGGPQLGNYPAQAPPPWRRVSPQGTRPRIDEKIARTRARGNLSRHGRSGSNSSEPWQPRNGPEPVYGSCRRTRTE